MKIKEHLKNKLRQNNKGVSLVEVVAAVTILGIIVVGIFPAFSVSHTHIFSMGDKNKAMSVLQGKIDLIYTISNIEDAVNSADAMRRTAKVNEIRLMLGAEFDNTGAFIYTAGTDFKFSVENVSTTVSPPIQGLSNNLNGVKVTVVYFYKANSEYISLSAFKKGGA
ncbi:MAG: prepilin-type N-terminal cleavage/methylation domain-containing protein [Clostridia bacterium]|nr:prepilin-type N-terminal cleavage/methylation domain-containing protein [Clostridia bacterium]